VGEGVLGRGYAPWIDRGYVVCFVIGMEGRSLKLQHATIVGWLDAKVVLAVTTQHALHVITVLIACAAAGQIGTLLTPARLESSDTISRTLACQQRSGE